MIKFKCPHCGKEVSAGDEHAGKNGRCPGCKQLFVIPAARAAAPPQPAPAPAAERRTPPPLVDEDKAPPKKKKPADYDPDDPDAVEELKKRVGVKVVKRDPDEEDEPPRKKKAARDDEEDDAPRKRKPARDEDDDEAIAEAPRKKRPAGAGDEDEDDRPRKKRGRDDDEDDQDEPRARRKRGRDDEDEEEDDRPRRRKKAKGEYAKCPNCRARGATLVSFTWWGGILGPRLFTHVRCNRCGTCYNGKTGDYNTTKIAIYVGVSSVIGIILLILVIVANAK